MLKRVWDTAVRRARCLNRGSMPCAVGDRLRAVHPEPGNAAAH